MWYDDLLTCDEEEARTDAYWQRLEDYWYRTRPHTEEKDFEELRDSEVRKLQQDFDEHMELRLNPERYYGVSR